LVEAAGIEPASENLQLKASTCLSRVLFLIRKDTLGRVSTRTSLLNVSLCLQQARRLGYPVTCAPSIPTGKKRRDASHYAARAYSLLLASKFFPGGFTSHRSARHAALASTIPVETFSPPLKTFKRPLVSDSPIWYRFQFL
jgi:hypothetical protein